MSTVVKLTFSDGIIGRMQFVGDVSDSVVQEAIDKTVFENGGVIKWEHSTLEELAPLIAAQALPPPEPPRDPLAELDALTDKLKSAKSFDDLSKIETAEVISEKKP